MSGLLQRLAARATGSAWALRSDARLPFCAASAHTAEAPGAAPHEPAALPGTVDAERGAAARQPAPPLTGRAHDPVAIAARTAPMAAMREQPATAAPHPTPIAKPQPSGGPQQPPGPDGAMHAARPGPAREPAMASAPAPWNNPPAAHADPRPLLATRAEGGAVNARGQPSPAPGATSAGTLGTLRAPHPLPALHQPATASRPAGPAEVHIHIGRIEVTALPAAQPSQRQARERTRPLSLDAYLKQRKEPS